MFSTITTAPSTIMPMPMASPPNDIRFALRPYHFIMMKAKSAASGRTSVTMSALRTSASSTIENDEDENRAFCQRLGHGVDGLFYQIGAVVERHQLDAFGQRLLDGGQLFFDRVDHIAAARAFEHQHDAGDGFALAVGRHRALAQLRADLHVGHVADVNRRVILRARR